MHPEWGDNVMITKAITAGDPDGAFAAADVTVKARFRMNRHCASPMETRAVLAAYDKSQKLLTLWSWTQVPHLLRTHIGRAIDQPEHLFRVIAPDVGGGFGMKAHVFPEEILCALVARELGRPVKWTEDRSARTVVRNTINRQGANARQDGRIVDDDSA